MGLAPPGSGELESRGAGVLELTPTGNGGCSSGFQVVRGWLRTRQLGRDWRVVP